MRYRNTDSDLFRARLLNANLLYISFRDSETKYSWSIDDKISESFNEFITLALFSMEKNQTAVLIIFFPEWSFRHSIDNDTLLK